MNTQMSTILRQIEFLFEKYSTERRATTQPYLLKKVEESINGYKYHPGDDLIRETLMEQLRQKLSVGKSYEA